MNIQQKLSVDPSVFDVVFVGGGPVALWTAAQVALRNPRLKVIVLEKYAEYQRIHQLFLEARSLATDCRSPELQTFQETFKNQRSVSTQVLESSLAEMAQKAGVVIQRQIEITNPEEDLACFSNAQVIVGADGAHSIVREHVVDASAEECFESRQDLHYIADLSYKEVREPVGFMKKVVMNSAVGNGIYEIHSKRTERTTLRTFISADVYRKMKDATRKTPKSLYSDELDDKVRKEFLAFLNAKYEGQARHCVDLSTATVTTTTLGTYISKQMVRRIDKRTWCLVGDAAFGVPFFRSLNNGLLCGTELSKAIASSFNPHEPISKLSKNVSLQRYGADTLAFARRQVWIAHLKSYAVNAWIKTAQIFHSMGAPTYLLSTAPSEEESTSS